MLLERDTPGVAEHGHRIHGVTKHGASRTFQALHQVDTVSRRSTCDFLEKNVAGWQAKDYPRGPFALDLMLLPAGHSGGRDWLWSHYLNSTPWGRLVVRDVCEFHLIWLSHQNRPGFWIRLHDGSLGPLDVLAAGNCSIEWSEKADEVSWR